MRLTSAIASAMVVLSNNKMNSVRSLFKKLEDLGGFAIVRGMCYALLTRGGDEVVVWLRIITCMRQSHPRIA